MTSPNDEGIYLLDVTAYIDGLSPDILRIGTVDYTTSPSDTPANQTYQGRLVNAGELKRVMFANGGTVGKPGATQGYFEIANADGALDAWLDYGIGGWDFSLYYLASRDAAYSTRTLAYKGTMRGFASDDLRTTIKIRIRDKLETLDRPFLTQRYAGTTNSSAATAEGDTSMANQVKPYSIGWNFQCDAKPANSPDLIYQASITPQAVIRAIEGGLDLTAAGTANYSTLALLRAATTGVAGSGADIEAGEYATCLNDSTTHASYVRLGATPAKAVTLQIRSSATEANLSIGAVAYQMLLDGGVLSGDIDAASFDLMKTSSGNLRCGIFIDSDISVIDAVCKVLNSVCATLAGTADGKIKAVSLGAVPDDSGFDPIFEGETVAGTFTNDDLSDDSEFSLEQSPSAEGDGVPAYAVYYSFQRHWKTLSPGDLNEAISPALARKYGADYALKLGRGTATSLTHQPLAQVLNFEGLTTIGGAIQAARLADIYGSRRDYLTFSVPMERAGSLDLGDIIVVKPTNAAGNPRFGYGADGKRGCIIGRHDQFSRRRVTFSVFVAVG